VSREFYLRSVHKRWQHVLSISETRVIVCSPYLTPKTALNVIQAASPARCTIYTRFSMEDFASGASSLLVLKSLLDKAYTLFEIPGLHAKILLASRQFASIGSQNLTANGVRNREATYCTEVEEEVAQIEKMLIPWLESATPITEDMIEDAMQLLPPIQKVFREIRQVSEEAELMVRNAQAERNAANAREAKRRAEDARSRQLVAKAVRDSIDSIIPNGEIDLKLAQSFIRTSAWWHSHSSGQLVRARNYADRIYGSNGDWKVNFGANTFLVGRAIRRCFQTMREYIDNWEAGIATDPTELVYRLRRHVAGAVAGYNGSEMHGFYPLRGDDMMFGTLSIDVKFFVREVLSNFPKEIIEPLRVENERINGA
jgi:hypothetical protein